MKSVFISIRPKWCERIASGEKTIEVRKTRPKLGTPFKCYIYCTGVKSMNLQDYVAAHQATGGAVDDWSDKVIGEFVCDCITGAMANNGIQTYYNGQKGTCLSDAEIIRYAGGKKIYYWHISDLKIYDKPRELGDFHHCGENYHFNPVVTKPPQSWCYVEELQ